MHSSYTTPCGRSEAGRPGRSGTADQPRTLIDLTAFRRGGRAKIRRHRLFSLPARNPEASDDELKGIADLIKGKGFDIGSLVAPVWPGTVGDSAMGTEEQRGKFLGAVKMACRIAKIFNEHGAGKRGVIRIDSAEFGVDRAKMPRPTPPPSFPPSRKLPRLPPTTASVSQPRAKSAGPACMAGRTRSTYSKASACRTR